MRRPLFVMVVLVLATRATWGQTSPPPDQTEQVKLLLERVQELEKRVSELESKQGAPPISSLSAANISASQNPESREAAAPSAQVHQHEARDEQAAVQQMETHYPSLQIRGFGDVDFSATDEKGTRSGFSLGQLDLHLASALSHKVSYFGEITFNARPTGYTVEVERSIIRYDYNDYFKLSFGRYHTPIGYWNTAFHHGVWLETTIDRPQMVKVGGSFTPIHFVGFLAEGNIPSGGAGLSYNFGVGNGRGEIISRPGDASDNNNNRAWVANIYSRPAKLYGLELGASVYRDKITLAGGQDYREWITAAYLIWTKGSPEFLTEFENVNHRNILTGKVANSDAFYVQFAYRLPWFERTLKPYYRFEYTHMPFSEEVFKHQDQVESILGLRYDISSYAAFKGEYRNTRAQPGNLGQPAQPVVNGLFLQTAFTF
ncbi:MAG TPA: porin [Candidatus Dormibacteraeota bacterium]|nr:porin [Candidatus Dormibacteraeota bacterium]